MRFLFVLILAGLMHAARSFSPDLTVGGSAAGTTLACGYLLLSAFLMGSIFKSLRLPRLTGYLTTGIIVGPQVLDLVSAPMLSNLQIFNGVATALIALTAGVELDLDTMKPLLKSISWLTAIAVCGTIVLISCAAFLLQGWLPFLRELPVVQIAALSLVLGVTMVAQSPAVVVALQSEMAADGPLTRTVLGIVVISDLLVIVIFAIVSSIAKSFLGSNDGCFAHGKRAGMGDSGLALNWRLCRGHYRHIPALREGTLRVVCSCGGVLIGGSRSAD